MPQKEDPYAGPRAKMVDLLLCLLAIAVILIVVLTAPRHHGAQSHPESASRAGQLAAK